MSNLYSSTISPSRNNQPQSPLALRKMASSHNYAKRGILNKSNQKYIKNKKKLSRLGETLPHAVALKIFRVYARTCLPYPQKSLISVVRVLQSKKKKRKSNRTNSSLSPRQPIHSFDRSLFMTLPIPNYNPCTRMHKELDRLADCWCVDHEKEVVVVEVAVVIVVIRLFRTIIA